MYNVTTEEITIAIDKNCCYRKVRVTCEECQKQQTDQTNTNGKQPAVIKNSTEKPQQRVNGGSDVIKKRSASSVYKE